MEGVGNLSHPLLAAPEAPAVAVLARKRQKAGGQPLTWTPQWSTAAKLGRDWPGRPDVLLEAPFSETQPVSLMRRQERGLCLKFTSKSQSAVFKENRKPCAPGRAEGTSGAKQSLPSSGGNKASCRQGLC